MIIKCKTCDTQYNILPTESVKCSCSRQDLINAKPNNEVIDGSLLADLSMQERYVNLYFTLQANLTPAVYKKATAMWKVLNYTERREANVQIISLNNIAKTKDEQKTQYSDVWQNPEIPPHKGFIIPEMDYDKYE